MKKLAAIAAASLLLSSIALTPAKAFSDLNDSEREAVMALKHRGVVSGVTSDSFAPKSTVTFAQSLQMIVKGLDLNLDHIRFIKKPEAADIFTRVANDAWYADAFVTAHYNGLELPGDVDPNAVITREQFANLLVTALEKKGDFPLLKIFIIIQDEDQITPEYQGALQRSLIYKIAKLDDEGKFNPKQPMTRGEAAQWVHNAAEMVDRYKNQQKPQEAPAEEVELAIEKVNDEVNKVTLSRGEKPTGGYGIEITGIEFRQDGKAIIRYTLTNPNPDSMNTMVITYPKAETYVSSKYEVVAEVKTE